MIAPLLIAAFLLLGARAQAGGIDEQRAHALARQIRCVVCQGQSIDESDAGIAHDLNALLREKMRQGWSDAQILDYLTARYGNFIRLKPPFAPATLLLWLGPLIFVGAAGGALLVYWKKRP
ncbi:MAG TPA: cytochrome c-type biogenesis protein [Dongiaceae bacterium]|jgi:cytochrome c-type biogenesis protein CcmH|nr:cytochrome c-type biogenesis protein [Dongiaceae bacterium]